MNRLHWRAVARWLAGGVFFLLALGALPACAADAVTVVLSDEGGAYVEVAERLRQSLAQKSFRGHVAVLNIPAFHERRAELERSGGVVVAVGLAATQATSVLDSRVPVLSILVPRAAFEQVARDKRRTDTRTFSAVYLDQPYSRQLALIRQALPDRGRVGVLLGTVSADQLAPLQSAARSQRLTVASEKVSREEDIVPALNRLLRDSRVLLAVPDPLVYSRNTVQGVLLTTYRYQVPVFGFSQAYVKAGALGAVYSSPGQVGQQAAEIVMVYSAGRGLPPPQYPKYFAVSINYQVARSMGIEVENEAVLYDRLMRNGEVNP